MFKIPDVLPTPRARIEEIADYIEYECLKAGNVTFYGVMKPVNLIKDEITFSGIEDESDAANAKLEEVEIEINRRTKACNGKYPFELSNRGFGLKAKDKNLSYWVYNYLLLSTRFNMSEDHIWNGIDGTTLLEKISAIVAKEYLGERADSFVFGTAVEGKFKDKIKDLCKRVGEGISFQSFAKHSPIQKDDKLDVVAWKSFSDELHSKLIVFGQCKTGTSWEDQQTIELQPDSFCRKWLQVYPVVTPVKMFFCSQYFPIDSYNKAINAGIVFDRLRILDYLPNDIDSILASEIENWCTGALAGIPLLTAKRLNRASK